MAFTGKSTYTAGTTLPEIADDVSDLVSIVSPHETPLLDALGDPLHAATSTRHEWIDDELLPNTDNIHQPGLSDTAMTTTAITVFNGGRFRVGDQVQADGSPQGSAVRHRGSRCNTLTVARGLRRQHQEARLGDGFLLRILGNAASEGSDPDNARFSSIRTCATATTTQIFSAATQGSERDGGGGEADRRGG